MSLTDGVSGGEMNESVEGGGALRSPDEMHTFLEEIQERTSDVCKSGNEGAMVSEDSQRRSYFFDRFQDSGPFSDARNFARVDAESFAIKQET